MKAASFVLCLMLSAHTVTTRSESLPGDAGMSVISVPIAINLAALERQLNERIPEHLETIDKPGEVCVEAEWLKTKGIPKCSVKDGYKIHCKDTWIKTKVSPEIKCDVSGWVKRNGRITLRGSASQLTLSVPLKAHVTAQGRGEIGKNVTQTLRAGTIITADVVPDITPDWQPTMAIDTRFRWSDRPEFKLFNLIPVTVGSKVEPELRKLLDELEDRIPSLLAEARVKEQVTAVWTQVQKPFLLDEAREIWAKFTPAAIGFSGIETTANIAKASFAISGVPQVGLGAGQADAKVSPLPALTRIRREQPRFHVELPVDLPLKQLEALAADQIDDLSPIPVKTDGYESTLEISNLEIASSGRGLKLALDFALDSNQGFWNKVDVFGLLDVKGRATFTAVPLVDSANNIVRLGELDFDTATNNKLADSLVDVARLPAIRELIRKSISYNFSQEVDKVREVLGKELNRQLSDDVRVVGRIDELSVQQPQISAAAVRVPILLQGGAEVLLGL